MGLTKVVSERLVGLHLEAGVLRLDDFLPRAG